ncbi:MAG: efflux RND transporter periplasmic adaptor subunit [Planctomycetaceae bacterium]
MGPVVRLAARPPAWDQGNFTGWRWGPLLLGLVLGPALMGCGQPAAASRPAALGPVRVDVAKPVQQEVTDYAEFTGQLAAAEAVEVRARVTGFIDRVLFDQVPAGDPRSQPQQYSREVAAGELLYQIDPREAEAAIASAEAKLSAAKAQIRAAEAQRMKAKNDLDRQQQLKDRGAASAEEFDRAVTGEREAVAAQDAAIAAREGAEAALRRATLNLDFTKITAPIAGRISRSLVSAGNLVNQDSTLLTTIVSVDPIYAEFDLDERTLLVLMQRIRDGEFTVADQQQPNHYPVELALANETDFPHQGSISFVDNRVEQSTGTMKIRAVFANPIVAGGGGRVLIPGLFARIRLPVSRPHPAVLIDERAVGRDQGQTFVYLVDEQDTVVFRPVTLGPTHGGLRAVANGLQPGDRVVVNGLQRIRPGVKVEPREVAMGSGPAATPAPTSSNPAVPKPAAQSPAALKPPSEAGASATTPATTSPPPTTPPAPGEPRP